MMLTAPPETAAEKKVHGTSATYENSGYGTWFVGIFTAFWTNTVNTTMKVIVGMTAQAKPRNACL